MTIVPDRIALPDEVNTLWSQRALACISISQSA